MRNGFSSVSEHTSTLISSETTPRTRYQMSLQHTLLLLWLILLRFRLWQYTPTSVLLESSLEELMVDAIDVTDTPEDGPTFFLSPELG
jgi:hypothetical protein